MGSRLSRPPGPASAFTAPRGVARDSLRLARALDSLVRVSRRVGWVAEVRRGPLAARRTGGAAYGVLSPSAPRAGDGAGGGRPPGRCPWPCRRSGPGPPPAPGRCKARPRGRGTFARGRPAPIRGRSRRSAAEGWRPGAGGRPRRRAADAADGQPPDRVAAGRPATPGLSPPGGLHGPHPFTSRRVHALLNSLFKVLFNFPSRYFSAIGPVPVFSLRWSLPPALGCIPKQPDSGRAAPGRADRPPPATGLAPSPAVASTCRWGSGARPVARLPYATTPSGARPGDSAMGSSLFARRYWGNPC